MREQLLMAGLCLVVVLASLATVAWSLFSGMGITMDTLLLIGICLLVALIFGLNFLLLLHEAGFLPTGKRR
jgi:hypothetical protein